MPCYNCNYQYGNYNCAVCRGQTPSMMPRVGTARAAEKSGEAIMRALLWILTNRYLSFPSFFIGAQALILALASVFGLAFVEGSVAPIPTWLMIIMIVVPVATMIRFRKIMPLLAVEIFRYVAILWLLKLFYAVITS